MSTNGKAAGLVLLGITIVLVCLVTQEPAVSKTSKLLREGREAIQERLSQLPIVEYSDENETSPVRKARNNRHNSVAVKDGVKKPKLNENMRPSLFDLPLSHQPIEPALPITSEVIAIGTVENAQAFLSTDRTSIYSEITFVIEEVLKGNERLAPGIKITAERDGGAVRFASGKTLYRGSWGRNVPIVSHRYLIFLKRIEGDDSFSIVTGYDLANNEVVPLDGAGDNNEQEAFKSYQTYRHSSVSQLLDDLKKALADQVGIGARDEDL
jgi:hypothetical protein